MTESLIEWMPIASAPRDGTEVLLAASDGSMAIAWWGKVYPTVIGWTDGEYHITWATHWAPKPLPPKDAE